MHSEQTYSISPDFAYHTSRRVLWAPPLAGLMMALAFLAGNAFDPDVLFIALFESLLLTFFCVGYLLCFHIFTDLVSFHRVWAAAALSALFTTGIGGLMLLLALFR